MRTKYEFIEGYVGNDTIRGWKKVRQHLPPVFACVRGTPGYPQGERASGRARAGCCCGRRFPAPEIFGQSNTYGPMANFKISLRELPDEGTSASRSRPRATTTRCCWTPARSRRTLPTSRDVGRLGRPRPTATVTIDEAGIYQVDVYLHAGRSPGLVVAGTRRAAVSPGNCWSRSRPSATTQAEDQRRRLLLVRLAGRRALEVVGALRRQSPAASGSSSAAWPTTASWAERFRAFEQRSPLAGRASGPAARLRQHADAGRRAAAGRDERTAGRTCSRERSAIFPVPTSRRTTSTIWPAFARSASAANTPTAATCRGCSIRSVEFEGPFYDIVAAGDASQHLHRVAASRGAGGVCARGDPLVRHAGLPPAGHRGRSRSRSWRSGKRRSPPSSDFQQSVKDALLVVLTSPQFLFLIENSSGPEPEDLDRLRTGLEAVVLPVEHGRRTSGCWNWPRTNELHAVARRGGRPA